MTLSNMFNDINVDLPCDWQGGDPSIEALVSVAAVVDVNTWRWSL